MKKNRFATYLLALALTAGLLAPFSAAKALSTDDMQVAAKAAILVDTNYGEVLFEQNAHDKLFPASITKVMTGLLAIEAVEAGKFTMDQPITATQAVNSGMMSGASTQNIKAGEIMSFGDVLRCALIPSANEACNILAELVGGSIEGFVALMNERAAALGCENTHFMNPHGLHDDNHYTTAYDISLICIEAMKSPIFREIVSSKSYSVPATNLAPIR
ncbi:MAG: serine hydrolase, partial [Pseudoflavonifractor sp.]